MAEVRAHRVEEVGFYVESREELLRASVQWGATDQIWGWG